MKWRHSLSTESTSGSRLVARCIFETGISISARKIVFFFSPEIVEWPIHIVVAFGIYNFRRRNSIYQNDFYADEKLLINTQFSFFSNLLFLRNDLGIFFLWMTRYERETAQKARLFV